MKARTQRRGGCPEREAPFDKEAAIGVSYGLSFASAPSLARGSDMDMIFTVLALAIVAYIAIKRGRSFFWGFLAALLFQVFHLPAVFAVLAVTPSRAALLPMVAIADIGILVGVVAIFQKRLQPKASDIATPGEYPICEVCGVEYIPGEVCGCGVVRGKAPKPATLNTGTFRSRLSAMQHPICEVCGVEYIPGEACACGVVREGA